MTTTHWSLLSISDYGTSMALASPSTTVYTSDTYLLSLAEYAIFKISTHLREPGLYASDALPFFGYLMLPREVPKPLQLYQ